MNHGACLSQSTDSYAECMVWFHRCWVSQVLITQRWSLLYVLLFHVSVPESDYFGIDQAIANHVEANSLQDNPGPKKNFNLFVRAAVGPEVADRWAKQAACLVL